MKAYSKLLRSSRSGISLDLADEEEIVRECAPDIRFEISKFVEGPISFQVRDRNGTAVYWEIFKWVEALGVPGGT